MSEKLDNLADELNRRFELVEFHLLSIVLNVPYRSTLENHGISALKIINPKYKYESSDFCRSRKKELEEKYFDDFGRLKEI